jgi:mannose-6-phosphate isomerase
VIPEILVLENSVQHYAWGSRTAIASFLGRPPSGDPEAELWIGAHPKAPSRVVAPDGSGMGLDQLILDSPADTLGAEVAAEFGQALPFLLKVLAAAEPLSIQCHPNRAQAEAGFERETRLGIPMNARERNYRDRNHKPELVVALSPFPALHGFRSLNQITRLFSALRLPEADALVRRIARTREADALRALLAALLSGEPASERLVSRGAEAAVQRRDEDPAFEWVVRLQDVSPGDPGVLGPLFLNVVELQPGEALFLGAGDLHAYLGGTALELMANSDNVIRGGLTRKHVDARELLSIATFRAAPPRILRAEPVSAVEGAYRTPAREFQLSILDVSGAVAGDASRHGLEILLGLEGDVVLSAGLRRLSLARGRSLFVPASTPPYSLEGRGRVCRAAVPAAARRPLSPRGSPTSPGRSP